MFANVLVDFGLVSWFSLVGVVWGLVVCMRICLPVLSNVWVWFGVFLVCFVRLGFSEVLVFVFFGGVFLVG